VPLNGAHWACQLCFAATGRVSAPAPLTCFSQSLAVTARLPAAANLTATRLTSTIRSVEDLPGKVVATYDDPVRLGGSPGQLGMQIQELVPANSPPSAVGANRLWSPGVHASSVLNVPAVRLNRAHTELWMAGGGRGRLC
jgi:outer membrane receptor protein involved in Fe transport